MGCGCGCGGHCSSATNGMGQFSLYMPFSGGLDVTTWGWEEWAIVAVGAYAVASMVFTTKAGYRSVQSGVRRRRSRKAKKQQLETAAALL